MDREMEIIALLSNHDDSFTYVDCKQDTVDHSCAKTGEQKQLHLLELEYFKEGRINHNKANFCEHCRQVFVLKEGD